MNLPDAPGRIAYWHLSETVRLGRDANGWIIFECTRCGWTQYAIGFETWGADHVHQAAHLIRVHTEGHAFDWDIRVYG